MIKHPLCEAGRGSLRILSGPNVVLVRVIPIEVFLLRHQSKPIFVVPCKIGIRYVVQVPYTERVQFITKFEKQLSWYLKKYVPSQNQDLHPLEVILGFQIFE